jgi:hypothetical protein
MSAQQQWRKNRVVWFEIPARDLGRAAKFYETILQTQLKTESFGSHEMRMFAYDDGAAGGCIMAGPGYAPAAEGVVTYLNADPNLDTVLARVEPAGGKIAVPRTELPKDLGCFAHIIDSEGNRVGLHAMA